MRTPSRSGVPADRPRHFCDGGGVGRIASLVPRGAGDLPPESAKSRTGGLTVRGPTVRFACRVFTFSPCPPPCPPPEPSLALSQALASAEPTLLSLKRFSLPQVLSRRGRPASARGGPLSGFCPEPALCAQSAPLSSPSSTLRACVWPAENGRSLAAYLARYGEHGSHLRGLMR